MTVLRLILGDQLSRGVSALSGIAAGDVVLMVEAAAETTYVRHHKQKVAFILSAMRHFAEGLRRDGLDVDYVRLDDAGNTGTFTGELGRAIVRHMATRVIATEPGEWRVREMMLGWFGNLGVPVDIRDDDRFFASRAHFAAWAAGRKTYRMEYFYREMRKETGLLMEGATPAGGAWNFDAENRKALPAALVPPKRLRFAPDAITSEVLDLVRERFADHFGDLDPFGWAVTRAQARDALDHFVTACLPLFGDYQDAMKRGEPFLFHGLLSPYLNVGLLTPREVCRAAEEAYRSGAAPLNAAEGFIRQVLGWREYVRGLYWLMMPGYANTNALGASRPLPAFYWTGETELACMSAAIADTRHNAYANHIQRLMITGNFALLAGIAPNEIEEWYLAVYADAYEWVELPNVHGMVLFADGGTLSSKPYAASGAYIDRMSDYCQSCVYDPALKTGAGACPFNLLYWHFLIESRKSLAGNPRMSLPYRTLDRMPEDRRATITQEAKAFLATMDAQPKAVVGPVQGDLFG